MGTCIYVHFLFKGCFWWIFGDLPDLYWVYWMYCDPLPSLHNNNLLDYIDFVNIFIEYF